MSEEAKKTDVARREEEILQFWRVNNIFKKSLEKDSPNGKFVFYDGPPFATGLPHYGHILAGTIKDVIPRYYTMQGYHVRRKWGWDCHGLPLENEIERELGLKSKKDIEEIGVEKFNEAARSAVLRYADDWRRIIPRTGRFVDMDDDYRTMDPTYTESVWWVFKTLYDKKLISEGFKSMHICPRCGTTLSNFEVAQGYHDITDLAVTVKLELKDKPGTYLLVWTTTPWTLPGNMAAAIDRRATYAEVRITNQESSKQETVILAESRVPDVLQGMEYEIVEIFKGEKLIGQSYTPPFDYFVGEDIKYKENAWKIYHADYVGVEEGTGAVHLAPAFGAEDMELAEQGNIPIVHHVNKDGAFVDAVKDFAGIQVKPKGDHQSTDVEIIKNLAHRNLLFKKEKITHAYPHCWRCDTPLLNYAASSWFVRVPEIKDKIIAENKKVHWVPEDIRDGRFGKWLEGSPDWAISRSRYWGAPIPVWRTERGQVVAVGSLEELQRYTRKSNNTYHLMRHGEAVSNTKDIVSTDINEKNPLTKRGVAMVNDAISKLEGINVIFSSPFERTRMTAELIAKGIGLSPEAVVYDDRLGEIQAGEFNGKSITAYHEFLGIGPEWCNGTPKGGESWNEVKRRVGEFLYDIDTRYAGKNVLIISHNSPLRMFSAVAEGLSLEGTAFDHAQKGNVYENAEVRTIDFSPLPHNKHYELDLHRPYIDELDLFDEEGKRMTRVPDVFDCWFESGSMPYGGYHHPFENVDIFNPGRGIGYPAHFIAEGLDQTRGWFYSLMVLGVALFGKSPYQNVIVNGTVLAEDGKKMSKRLKNYPDPMELIDAHGADAMRYYLLSSPLMQSGDLSFSQKGVQEIQRKVIGRLDNVFSFYQLYADDAVKPSTKSKHVLDVWILARLNQLIEQTTCAMEDYMLDRATRPIGDFIEDLSIWYIRRSRDRFKSDNKKDALQTTRYVLEELSNIMAPFMPFYAEYLYRHLIGATKDESVHLENWPKVERYDEKILTEMERVRDVVTKALDLREKAGLKVRQPLAKLTISESLDQGILAVIKDEVNVKEVLVDSNSNDVVLDTTITPELKEEGMIRDFIRAAQDYRKKEGFDPLKRGSMFVATDTNTQKLIERHEAMIQKTVLLESISFEHSVSGGEEIDFGDTNVTFLISK